MNKSLDLQLEDEFSYLKLKKYFLDAVSSMEGKDSYFDKDKVTKILSFELLNQSSSNISSDCSNEKVVSYTDNNGNQVQAPKAYICCLADLLGINVSFATELWKQSKDISTQQTLEYELELHPGILQTKGSSQTLTTSILFYFFVRQCFLECLKAIVIYENSNQSLDILTKLKNAISHNLELTLFQKSFDYGGFKPLASGLEGGNITDLVKNYILAENDTISETIYHTLDKFNFSAIDSTLSELVDIPLNLLAEISSKGSENISLNLLNGLLSIFDCDGEDSDTKQKVWNSSLDTSTTDSLLTTIDKISHDGVKGTLYLSLATLLSHVEADLSEIDKVYNNAFELRALAFLRLMLFSSNNTSIDLINNIVGRYMIHYQTIVVDETNSFSILEECVDENRDSLFDLLLLCQKLVEHNASYASLYFSDQSEDSVVVYKDFLETMMYKAEPTNRPNSLFVGTLSFLSSLVREGVEEQCKVELFRFMLDSSNNSAFSWKFFSKMLGHHIAKINNDFGAVTQGQSQYASIATKDQIVVASFLAIFNGICSSQNLDITKDIVINEIREINSSFVQVLEMLLVKQNQNLSLKATINIQIFRAVKNVVRVLLKSKTLINKTDAARLVHESCFPLIDMWFKKNVLNEFVLIEFIGILLEGLSAAKTERLELTIPIIDFLVNSVLPLVDFTSDSYSLGLRIIELLDKSLEQFGKETQFEKDIQGLLSTNLNYVQSGNFYLMSDILTSGKTLFTILLGIFSTLAPTRPNNSADAEIRNSWYRAARFAANLTFQAKVSAFATEGSDGYGYGYLKLRDGTSSSTNVSNLMFNKVALFLENPPIKGSESARPFMLLGPNTEHSSKIAFYGLSILNSVINKQAWFIRRIKDISGGKQKTRLAELASKVDCIEVILSQTSMTQLMKSNHDSFFTALFIILASSREEKLIETILKFLFSTLNSMNPDIVMRALKSTEIGGKVLEEQRTPGILSISFITFLKRCQHMGEGVVKLLRTLLEEKQLVEDLCRLLVRNESTPKVLQQLLDESLNHEINHSATSSSNHDLISFQYSLLAKTFALSDVASENGFWLRQYDAIFVYLNQESHKYSTEIFASTLKGLSLEIEASSDFVTTTYFPKLFNLEGEGSTDDITVADMLKKILVFDDSINDVDYFYLFSCLKIFIEKTLIPKNNTGREKKLDKKLMQARSRILRVILSFVDNLDLKDVDFIGATECIVLLTPQLLRVQADMFETYNLPYVCKSLGSVLSILASATTETFTPIFEGSLQNILCANIHVLNRLSECESNPATVTCLDTYTHKDYCISELVDILNTELFSDASKVYSLCMIETSFSIGGLNFDVLLDVLRANNTLRNLVRSIFECFFQNSSLNEIAPIFSKLVLQLLQAISRKVEGASYLSTTDILVPLQGSSLLSSQTSSDEANKFVFEMLRVSNVVLENLKPNTSNLFDVSNKEPHVTTQTEKFILEVLKFFYVQRTSILQSVRSDAVSIVSDVKLNLALTFQVLCNCFELSSINASVLDKLYPQLAVEMDELAWKLVYQNVTFVVAQNYNSLKKENVILLESIIWYLLRRMAIFTEQDNDKHTLKLRFEKLSALVSELYSFYLKVHPELQESIRTSLEGLISLVAVFVNKYEKVEPIHRSRNLPSSTQRLVFSIKEAGSRKELSMSTKQLNSALKDWVE